MTVTVKRTRARLSDGSRIILDENEPWQWSAPAWGQPSPIATARRLLADCWPQARSANYAKLGLDPVIDVSVIQVIEHAHAITDNLIIGFASQSLGAAIEHVASAHGLITATPIFNTFYRGLVKSLFDNVGP